MARKKKAKPRRQPGPRLKGEKGAVGQIGPDGLSDAHRKFVAAYIERPNATQAAIRAGYSPLTASEQASHLLGQPNIQAAIQAWRERCERVSLIKAEHVRREWALMVFSDITDYVVNEAGDVDVKPGVDRSALRAVQSVELTTTTRGQGEAAVTERKVKLKLWDKPGPTRDLAKHMGMLVDRKEVSGPDGGAIPLGVVLYLPKKDATVEGGDAVPDAGSPVLTLPVKQGEGT